VSLRRVGGRGQVGGGAQILESTRRVDTIVLDKTGTVTTGRMGSSLVTAPTQCPQVSPVTGKVWVLMWFSL
jgi:cation transport ATPase